MIFWPALIDALGAVIAWVIWQHRSRRAYIDGFEFPEALRMKFRERRPGLLPAQEGRVFEGLRQWFRVCHAAGGRRVSMPSQAVDDAWHAFILFTRNYQLFCGKAFGRFLHHTPAEAMRTQTEPTEGIRRSWRLACGLEGIDPRLPQRLPLLFALDMELGISDGYRYSLNCAPGSGTYCAGGIGCSSGCSSGCSGDGGGGGCGGD